MKCRQYHNGYCFDKTGKNNSADGACMFPEQCDLNGEGMSVIEITTQEYEYLKGLEKQLELLQEKYDDVRTDNMDMAWELAELEEKL